MERCHSQAQELQSYTDSLFQGLFAHRFRHGTAARWERSLRCNRHTARTACCVGHLTHHTK